MFRSAIIPESGARDQAVNAAAPDPQPSSRRNDALLLVAVALLAAAGWLWALRDLPPVLWSGDGYEYADAARRLARGDGFTTGVIYPPHLAYGVDAHHPSLVRPPVWPLAVASFFAVAGPGLGALHAAAGLFFVAAAVGAAALALGVAGRAAGAAAGLAVATSPALHLVAVGGLSETAFAFWIALAFVGAARRWPPAAVGAVAGLAYLTRYDGLALGVVLAGWVALERRRAAPVAALAAGFALVALPWWVRNALVTGQPFYALTGYNLFMAPGVGRIQGSILYQLEPDLASPVAVNPFAKAARQLPTLLLHWPPASANLAACVGVALACVRRERTALACAALAIVTTVGIAFALALGRYFVPLLPVVLACGCAGWWRFGGALRAPGTALVLLAPLLPSFPATAPDLQWTRNRVEEFRALARSDPERAARGWVDVSGAPRCMGPGTVVVGDRVAPLVWETDAVGIHLPRSVDDVDRLLDRVPVDFVQVRDARRMPAARFAREFEPRPECGEDVYGRRRPRAG